MMLIRFPMHITKQELPPKPESRTKVIGQTLVLIAIVLFLLFVFAPMLEIGMNG